MGTDNKDKGKAKRARDTYSDTEKWRKQEVKDYNPLMAAVKGEDHWQLTDSPSKKVQGGKFAVRKKPDAKKIADPKGAGKARSRMNSMTNWKVDKAAHEKALVTPKPKKRKKK